MSLLAWYPLTSNGKNQGLDGIDLSTMGTVEYTAGKLGNSAVFVGNTANCLHRPYFSELKTNFTWCCWFKINAETEKAYQFILSQGRDYEILGFNIYISQYSGTTLCVNYGNVTPKTMEERSNRTLTVAKCELNTWYHVAVTVNESAIKVYLNGELKATGVYDFPDYKYANEGFVIGKMAHQYTDTKNYFPFYGQICDVRVYDEVISLKEIKELSKGLMLHYKLSSVGGDNLWGLTNSKVIPVSFSLLGGFTCTKINHDDYTEVVCTNAGTSSGGFYKGFYFSPFPRTDDKYGKTYTWSFYAKCNTEKVFKRIGHEAGGCKEINLTTEWQRFTCTWKFSDTGYGAFVFYNYWEEGDILYLKDFKIEEGDKATPWCPSKTEELYNTLGLNSNIEYDCSGYGNDATKHAITKVSSDSIRFNSSYNFTNLDRIGCPNIPFENMEQGTMSFWIKFNKFKNWSHYVFFADTFDWTGQEKDFIIVANYTSTSETTSTKICIDCCSYTIPVDATIDKWYHIAITWDAKNYTIKKYLNGNLIHDINDSTNKRLDTYRSKHLYHALGNVWSNEGYTGDFNMSDFRIYATNLSDKDIKTMYETPISITKDGNLFSYELEEI